MVISEQTMCSNRLNESKTAGNLFKMTFLWERVHFFIKSGELWVGEKEANWESEVNDLQVTDRNGKCSGQGMTR